MGIPGTIVCVDCGGTCHRSPLGAPETGWRVGDVVTYRCRECADVWYVELDAVVRFHVLGVARTPPPSDPGP